MKQTNRATNKKSEILYLCFVLGIVLVFLSSVASADIVLKKIAFSSSSPTAKITVTVQNTFDSNKEVNLTLFDLSNDKDYQEIGAVTHTISGNDNMSFIFGGSESSDYDYSLNENWNPYRCGTHQIKAKIWFDGTSRTLTKDMYINLENLDVQITPEENISMSDNVKIKIRDDDKKAVNDLEVTITFKGDNEKHTYTTNSNGEISFKPKYDFSPSSVGIYTITSSKHEKIRDTYYCEISKEIEIKKKLKIESITPLKPKINERITMTISADDYYGIYLWIEGPEIKNFPVTSSVTYFTLEKPGTYKISLLKDNDYWKAETTISVEQNPLLNILPPDTTIVGTTATITTTDKDNLRISGAAITIEDPDGTKLKLSTDWEGKIKYEIKKPGIHKLTAEKDGYTTTYSNFTALNGLNITLSDENPKVYDAVSIMLLDKNKNPVEGTIYIDNTPIQTRNGAIQYNFTTPKEYEIKAEAPNYISIKKTITPLKRITISLSKKNVNVGEEITISLKGEGLYMPSLTITNTNTNKSFSVSETEYTFKPDSPGNFSIKAEKTGFADAQEILFVNYMFLEIKSYYFNGKLFVNVSSDGKPLEDVKVTLIRPDNSYLPAQTNSMGTASFEVDKSGEYTIIAEKTNYEKKEVTVDIKINNDLLTTIIGLAIILSVIAVLLYVYKTIKHKK